VSAAPRSRLNLQPIIDSIAIINSPVHTSLQLEATSRMKDKLKGKAEELKGKATGDRVEELKGKGRQAVGDIKQTAKSAAYDAEHPKRDRA